MTNKLNHIGIQIVEKDINEFYVDVLKVKIEREFSLSACESLEIFNINKDVKIIYGLCDGFDIELFVTDYSKTANYNHICFYTDSVSEIVKNAKKNGYSVIKRMRNNRQTYFISDSNYNIFEIKSGK